MENSGSLGSISRSATPEPPTQPDHFWGQDDAHLPPSPHSHGRTWIKPEDDPFAARGIPVFKPTMEEFRDFEEYMKKIEGWGMRSGIVKVIPPREWTESLPPTEKQLDGITLKRPIEQLMVGQRGLFRQQNVERRKEMSVREWAELCAKKDYRAPGVKEVGRTHARDTVQPTRKPPLRTKKRGIASAGTTTADEVVHEPSEEGLAIPSPPASDYVATPKDEGEEVRSPVKGRRTVTKETREAKAAEKAAADRTFLQSLDVSVAWLPPETKPSDYTPEFCRELERQYWRNLGLGKPAWYGADTAGTLFTNATTSWNVGCLPSMLARLLPRDGKGLPGVNEPYLYFGMWRATFAWHVEDMDLFSINYIHFGAPKFWYAVPQGRASALEQTMKSYFPKDIKQCPQFLRHKSFLASPTLLAQSSCRPNTLVQHAGEFVITYPHGYHAGFNLGFNCAESVNFALDSWLDLARKAKVCECVEDSVRIDVDELLAEREEEKAKCDGSTPSNRGKRKAAIGEQENEIMPSKAKKAKTEAKQIRTSLPPSLARITSVKLKLGPRPQKDPDTFPCCLCVSEDTEGLLRVHDSPRDSAAGKPGADGIWRAHELCANVVPETWVDQLTHPSGLTERVVFGLDCIVKGRWGLKCSLCTRSIPRAHGAPVQCTKGKCPKAFHVSCARGSSTNSVVFRILRDIEKEVVINDTCVSALPAVASTGDQNSSGHHLTNSLPAPQAEPVSTALDLVTATSQPLQSTTEPKVFKRIYKAEYELLCHQHNPATAEAKKQGKADRLRSQLALLPPMSRIKIRVSAGVFEVSLVRVIEERGSVEVVWDRGAKREFKFSSIVLNGKSGEIVGYKPTEIAPDLDPQIPPREMSAGTMQPTPSLQPAPSAWSYNLYCPPIMPSGYRPYRPNQFHAGSTDVTGFPFQHPDEQFLPVRSHYLPQTTPIFPQNHMINPIVNSSSTQIPPNLDQSGMVATHVHNVPIAPSSLVNNFACENS